MVILVLVLVWVAVLTPRVVRHFKEAGSHSSIESFHEQLHLLERAGPKLVEPAYRLETDACDALSGGAATAGGASAPFRKAGYAARTDLALVDHLADSTAEGPVGPAPGWSASVRTRRLADDRRRSRKRRRDVLVGLLAVATVTGVLGAMHALHLLWAITGISVVAIAGYVALVAYAQLLNADRQAGRPVASRPLPVTPAWAARGPRHAAGERLPGVEVLASGSAQAARAGYPGAWDDTEGALFAPRHAAAR